MNHDSFSTPTFAPARCRRIVPQMLGFLRLIDSVMILYLIRSSTRPSRIWTSSTYHSAAYFANAWFAIVGMKFVASPRWRDGIDLQAQHAIARDQAADQVEVLQLDEAVTDFPGRDGHLAVREAHVQVLDAHALLSACAFGDGLGDVSLGDHDEIRIGCGGSAATAGAAVAVGAAVGATVRVGCGVSVARTVGRGVAVLVGAGVSLGLLVAVGRARTVLVGATAVAVDAAFGDAVADVVGAASAR